MGREGLSLAAVPGVFKIDVYDKVALDLATPKATPILDLSGLFVGEDIRS